MMQSNRLLVDEILQTFESDGNVFLILGAVTGKIKPDGEDIREPLVTLIVPRPKLAKMVADLQAVEKAFGDAGGAPDLPLSEPMQDKRETVGAGVVLEKAKR